MITSAHAGETAHTAEQELARIEVDLARIDSQLQAVAERLEDVAVLKTPQLGETGYLGHFCSKRPEAL